jgi:hypothetical protein
MLQPAQRVSRRWRLPFALLLLASVAVVPSAAAAAPATPADCNQSPVPDGCVTAIRLVDPSSFKFAATAQGGVEGTWDPSAAGITEQLASPETVSEAAAQAAANANAHGYTFTQGMPPAASIDRARHSAKASSYGGGCNWSAGVSMVSLGGNQYHMHAKSTQICFGVDNHAIATSLYRESTWKANDVASGFSGYSIATDAYATCTNLGNVHTWWNWSDFYAYSNGVLQQGPEGYFAPVDHHCT